MLKIELVECKLHNKEMRHPSGHRRRIVLLPIELLTLFGSE